MTLLNLNYEDYMRKFIETNSWNKNIAFVLFFEDVDNKNIKKRYPRTVIRRDYINGSFDYAFSRIENNEECKVVGFHFFGDFEDVQFKNGLSGLSENVCGYIDPDGNFYPLCRLGDYKVGRTDRKYFFGFKAIDIALKSEYISESDKIKLSSFESIRKAFSFSVKDWDAHRLLMDAGYCLFLVGRDGEKNISYNKYPKKLTYFQMCTLSQLFLINRIGSPYLRKKIMKYCDTMESDLRDIKVRKRCVKF